MFSVIYAIDRIYWLFCKLVLSVFELIYSNKTLQSPKTILVLRNCFFGDYVVVIPALRKLRRAFPDARIVLLVSTTFSRGWSHLPPDNTIFDIEPELINQVIRYTSEDLESKTARRALRARISYQEPIVSLHIGYSGESLLSRLKRIVLCKLLFLPFPNGLLGSQVLPAQKLFNRWRRGRNDIIHQYEAALASVNLLLQKFAVQPLLPDSGMLLTKSHAKLKSDKIIGLAPFSKQQVKQWPLERFAELIKHLASETGAHFEVYGASVERDMECQLSTIIEGCNNVTFLCGVLSPFELRKRLEAVDLLICLDSGPMHIACLVGTPVVAIFSQITLHNFWRPWGPYSSVVSTDVQCTQCNTRTGVCPMGTRACIDNISVDEVIKQVYKILNN